MKANYSLILVKVLKLPVCCIIGQHPKCFAQTLLKECHTQDQSYLLRQEIGFYMLEYQDFLTGCFTITCLINTDVLVMRRKSSDNKQGKE